MFIEKIFGYLLKKKINHCFNVNSASEVLEGTWKQLIFLSRLIIYTINLHNKFCREQKATFHYISLKYHKLYINRIQINEASVSPDFLLILIKYQYVFLVCMWLVHCWMSLIPHHTAFFRLWGLNKTFTEQLNFHLSVPFPCGSLVFHIQLIHMQLLTFPSWIPLALFPSQTLSHSFFISIFFLPSQPLAFLPCLRILSCLLPETGWLL